MSIISQTDWERLPTDPDLRTDLEYEMVDLDVIDLDSSDQVVMLPNEEDMLREDAFIVADGDAICDPLERL